MTNNNETKSHSLLCVDDEPDIIDALERLFRRKYNVLKATSGKEALQLLSENSVSVIICDQRMPGMTGVEVLKASLLTHPQCIRILLTGFTEIESIVSAINTGQVYKYVTKPWDPIDLQNSVDKAVEKYELRLELERKNKELQVLDEAKNHFMMLINHELKTPLTVIFMFLDLLKETSLDDDQHKYMDRISKSSARLQKIVDDVLILISAQTGLTPLVPGRISMEEFFKSLIEPLTESAQKKAQEITLNLNVTHINADENILTMILQRILDNAIKFGKENSKISIQLDKDPLCAESVRFSITNQGDMISKGTIEKIIKPFTLDEDILNHSRGLGLGLSVCQALLSRHSSQLQIESTKKETIVGFKITE